MSRFRYAYLLLSLCLVAFVRPFLSEQVAGVALVDIFLLLTLMAGVYAAVNQKHVFAAVAVLGGASAVLQVAAAVMQSVPLAFAFLVSGLLFYGAVSWAIVRKLFGHHRSVSRDTLYQAVSVYLLLGMLWSLAYALLELASPGSFSFTDNSETTDARFERFLGFSFTTLTTLGYGNVAPATPRADSLATLQAVVGQIYLAVVIARLVAISVAAESPDAAER